MRSARLALLGLLLACSDSPSEPAPAEGGVRIEGPATIEFDRLGAQTSINAVTENGEAVRWSSSRNEVATVSSGVITSVGDGSAFIIARAGSFADSVSVTVNQDAARVVFTTPPEHAVRGEPLLAPLRVALVDPGGMPVLRFTGAITVGLGAGASGATLAGTTTRPAVNGSATFDGLVIDVAGTGYRFTAEAADLDSESTPFDVVASPDRIVARNGAGHEVGLLVDGGGANGPFDDVGRVVQDSVAHIVASPGPSSDVLAFTRGRPPVLVSAPWTSTTDTFAFSFPDPIAIPVTVWVIKGPYDQQQARAAAAIATTSIIWDDERMGLSFSDVEFVDATADPDAPALYDLTLCNQQTLATNTIGKRPGRINIYYVGTVDGGTDRGRACAGGDFTMMAERSGHELLSHEIGHLFGLGHVDGDERFDRTNVMHSASSTRQYLTEAQVFRSHYNSYSALRSVYGVRTDPDRTCPDFALSAECPSLARRLFADGGFPADLANATVAEWLQTTCVVGDDAPSSTTASAAERAALRSAVVSGMPASVRNEVHEAAQRRARAIRERIAAGQRFGLDDAAVAAVQQMVGEGSADRQTAERDRSWRENARRALGSSR